MIDFQNVSFSYSSGASLRDVSFHIGRGEFVALVGENGAGKSTLSKLVNGLLKPLQGSVTVKGLDTRTTRTSEYARFLGFLFQNPDRQICCGTVAEELKFGLGLLGISQEEQEKRCARLLEEFGFSGSQDPFSLSRGERQRLALAGLLAVEPEVLILDEPTTGMDYRECMQLMERVRELNREQGATVLMVCHDMEVVRDFARRVLVLSGGRLLADGPVEKILDRKSVV